MSEPFEAWTIVWMSAIGIFLGLRECLPFLFLFLLFRFFGTLQFQGVPLGTLLRSRECVGFSGGCASVRNAPILAIQVHSHSYCFWACFGAVGPFYLSPILFCSLQYINETLCTVDTYLFASGTLRDNRKSYPYLISITRTTKLADSISTVLITYHLIHPMSGRTMCYGKPSPRTHSDHPSMHSLSHSASNGLLHLNRFCLQIFPFIGSCCSCSPTNLFIVECSRHRGTL